MSAKTLKKLLLKVYNSVYALYLTPHGDAWHYLEKCIVPYIRHCSHRILLHSNIKENVCYRISGLYRNAL